MEYMDIETVKELDHVFGDIEELQLAIFNLCMASGYSARI